MNCEHVVEAALALLEGDPDAGVTTAAVAERLEASDLEWVAYCLKSAKHLYQSYPMGEEDDRFYRVDIPPHVEVLRLFASPRPKSALLTQQEVARSLGIDDGEAKKRLRRLAHDGYIAGPVVAGFVESGELTDYGYGLLSKGRSALDADA